VAKNTQKAGLAGGLLLGVIAVIIAVVAYKQVFLVSRVVTTFPEAKLTSGLQACMQESLTPDMLKKDFAGNLSVMLSSVWSSLSTSMVKTSVAKNYVSELKVLNIQDFAAENAEIRVTGTLDLISEVPVIGRLESRKDYRTTVVKRGNEYHFNGLSVKKPDSQQWDEWVCAKTL
jgi:phage tail sheath gpL-like